MTMNNDITNLFCIVDDFCKIIEPYWNGYLISSGKKQRNRQSRLSLSEMMTIVLFHHYFPHLSFKDYYNKIISTFLKPLFPQLLSYSRFVRLKHRILVPLMAFFSHTKGKCTGISYVDSTPIKVCHNRRISSHKVFKGISKRGKSSTGWFFGFKLHVIINHVGELIDIYFTSGNVNDRLPLPTLCRNLFGKVFGDKGYLSKDLQSRLRSEFDVHLVTKVRRNMKSPEHSVVDEALLSHRSLIETVIGELKKRTNIQHTRHRSPRNFMVNLFSSLVQYNLFKKKPSLKSVLVL